MKPAGPTPKVDIRFAPVASIGPDVWDDIWQLTQAFYDTQRGYAEASLKRRQRLALFRSRRDGSLVGMAAVDIDTTQFRGRPIVVISTSHVLLREAYRGHNLLQRAGLRAFIEARLRHPWRPVYWFFDTFSYKSYLLLPRNFRHFWPHPGQPTPPREQALLHQLAERAYGADWRPDRGIVMRSGLKKLKPGAAPIEEHAHRPPALDFFLRANPGHAEGDMLACLCPLTLGNWLSLLQRAVRRLRRPARDITAS